VPRHNGPSTRQSIGAAERALIAATVRAGSVHEGQTPYGENEARRRGHDRHMHLAKTMKSHEGRAFPGRSMQVSRNIHQASIRSRNGPRQSRPLEARTLCPAAQTAAAYQKYGTRREPEGHRRRAAPAPCKVALIMRDFCILSTKIMTQIGFAALAS
jgi:hypothetical protein